MQRVRNVFYKATTLSTYGDDDDDDYKDYVGLCYTVLQHFGKKLRLLLCQIFSEITPPKR